MLIEEVKFFFFMVLLLVFVFLKVWFFVGYEREFNCFLV